MLSMSCAKSDVATAFQTHLECSLNDLKIMRARKFSVGVFFVFANVASARVYCSTNLGAPGLSSCYGLLQTFPSGSAPQIFNEEQLRPLGGPGSSWPGVLNPYPRPVEQLPKYWSIGQ